MAALDSGAKSFFSTLKEVGTDRAISEALIGGGVGIGGNMAYNVATGDSGGYTGAALLGGAAGGLGRAGLKHFNLETQASNLFSTMKTGSVGAMTQAQKTMGTKSNKPAGQIYRKGKNESNIQGYRNQEAMKLRQARKLNQEGYPTQAKELFSEADALAVRRKELLDIQEGQRGRMGRNPENMGKSNRDQTRPQPLVGPTQPQPFVGPSQPKPFVGPSQPKPFVGPSQSKSLVGPTQPKPFVGPSQSKKASNSNPATSGSASAGRGADDEHYSAALDYMINKGGVSTSGLQREFNMGYNRVSSMLDAFEADGFVSPANKNGKRNLLL